MLQERASDWPIAMRLKIYFTIWRIGSLTWALDHCQRQIVWDHDR